MDELDILKNNWKKSQDNYPKYSNDELYKMLHKKSSSVVKWILMISIIELLFITSLDLIINRSPEDDKILNDYHVFYLIKGITYLHYAIIFGFVVTFYINFKKINIVDDLKNLMSKILYIKNITNYYILYNLASMGITSLIIIIAAIIYDPTIRQLSTHKNQIGIYIVIIIMMLLCFTIFIGFFFFIYRLLYGRLIKKLTKNYEELKKLDL